MVLAKYWHIVWKRFWLIIALMALVVITYAISYRSPQPTYIASMRFTVGVEPEASPGTYYTYDRYYTWLTAEYLLDDLAEVVKSSAFAQDVAQVSGVPVPPGAIQGATSAGKLHRILSISISWPDREQLEKIANAIPQILAEQNNRYFKQLGTENALVTPIDLPTINVAGQSTRDKLDFPLRLLIALVVGVILVFLLDYLDTSIRGREDAASLGISIVGEIPHKRGPFSALRHHRMP